MAVRSIRSHELSVLLRLANELHDLPANPIIRHQHMLRTLCTLLKARIGVSALVDIGRASSDRQTVLMVCESDRTRESRILAERYLVDSRPMNPISAALRRRYRRNLETPLVETRSGLASNSEWYNSEYFQTFLRPLGLDSCLFSIMPFARSKWTTAINLYRSADVKRGFDKHDQLVLRMFHEQIQWLFKMDSPLTNAEAMLASLTPRQRETARLLLQGASEKQAAQSLQLSRHTVHEHVKAIYRALSVGTRGELLARFFAERG